MVLTRRREVCMLIQLWGSSISVTGIYIVSCLLFLLSEHGGLASSTFDIRSVKVLNDLDRLNNIVIMIILSLA